MASRSAITRKRPRPKKNEAPKPPPSRHSSSASSDRNDLLSNDFNSTQGNLSVFAHTNSSNFARPTTPFRSLSDSASSLDDFSHIDRSGLRSKIDKTSGDVRKGLAKTFSFGKKDGHKKESWSPEMGGGEAGFVQAQRGFAMQPVQTFPMHERIPVMPVLGPSHQRSFDSDMVTQTPSHYAPLEKPRIPDRPKTGIATTTPTMTPPPVRELPPVPIGHAKTIDHRVDTHDGTRTSPRSEETSPKTRAQPVYHLFPAVARGAPPMYPPKTENQPRKAPSIGKGPVVVGDDTDDEEMVEDILREFENEPYMV